MSDVKRSRNIIEHDVMEGYLSGDSVRFEQKTIRGHAWQCTGCGHIWAKRWYAEECEKRGHKSSFTQEYWYKPEGYQTHGRAECNVYTREALNGKPVRVVG